MTGFKVKKRYVYIGSSPPPRGFSQLKKKVCDSVRQLLFNIHRSSWKVKVLQVTVQGATPVPWPPPLQGITPTSETISDYQGNVQASFSRGARGKPPKIQFRLPPSQNLDPPLPLKLETCRLFWGSGDSIQRNWALLDIDSTKFADTCLPSLSVNLYWPFILGLWPLWNATECNGIKGLV